MMRPTPTLYLRFAARARPPLCEPAPSARVPLLERLLARATGDARIADWRRDAFALIAARAGEMPAPGAALLLAAPGPVAGASAYLATPVHYEAAMTSVHMAADGVLRLDAAQATTLAQDFDRVFGDGEQRLVATRDGRLVCVFDRTIVAATHDPQEAAGLDIGEFQATGADAPYLRRLTSEIEMWLYEHAINRAREAAGHAAINGLWLWGGGAVSASLPSLAGWTAGDDVLFGAWPASAQMASGAAPRGSESGVVALEAEPGTAEWHDVEARWLRPAIADLRAGRWQRLMLSAARRCYTITPGFRWRMWRRSRPWWEYFA